MVVTIVENARTYIGLGGLGDVNCESVSVCDCVCVWCVGGRGTVQRLTTPPPALPSPPHTYQNSHGTRQGGERL